MKGQSGQQGCPGTKLIEEREEQQPFDDEGGCHLELGVMLLMLLAAGGDDDLTDSEDVVEFVSR